jgi:hypothetical protein
MRPHRGNSGKITIELNSIDRIVEKEKNKAKTLKPGKQFKSYIKKIAK